MSNLTFNVKFKHYQARNIIREDIQFSRKLQKKPFNFLKSSIGPKHHNKFLEANSICLYIYLITSHVRLILESFYYFIFTTYDHAKICSEVQISFTKHFYFDLMCL